MPIYGNTGSATYSVSYGTLDEMLAALPDNNRQSIGAQEIRNSIYTVWSNLGSTGSGSQGLQGYQGFQGLGTTGSTGLQGSQGFGTTGSSGTQGLQGIVGNTGSGFQGLQGIAGSGSASIPNLYTVTQVGNTSSTIRIYTTPGTSYVEYKGDSITYYGSANASIIFPSDINEYSQVILPITNNTNTYNPRYLAVAVNGNFADSSGLITISSNDSMQSAFEYSVGQSHDPILDTGFSKFNIKTNWTEIISKNNDDLTVSSYLILHNGSDKESPTQSMLRTEFDGNNSGINIGPYYTDIDAVSTGGIYQRIRIGVTNINVVANDEADTSFGIGTTSPESMLHVKGNVLIMGRDSGSPTLEIQSDTLDSGGSILFSDVNDIPQLLIYGGMGSDSLIRTDGALIIDSYSSKFDSATDYVFRINDSSKFIISNEGRVSIGTSSNTSALGIYSDENSLLRLYRNSTSNNVFEIFDNGALYLTGDNGTLNAEIFKIDETGEINILTTNFDQDDYIQRFQITANTDVAEVMLRNSNLIVHDGTASDVNGIIKPYKVYSALLNQSSTGNPSANVLTNDFYSNPIWSRTNVGKYECGLTGAFIEAKTVVIGGYQGLVNEAAFDENAGLFVVTGYRLDDNTIRLNCGISDPTTYFDGLTEHYIEIRVYN